MSEPDKLRFTFNVTHPLPARDRAAVRSSCHLLVTLANDVIPVEVVPREPTSLFESWEVTRAAFIARMASTVRHLGYPAPS